MLEKFLEFGLPTEAIAATLEQFLSLGFAAVSVGDAYAYPYAVISDGRICIGLHEQPLAETRPIFVRPDLANHLPALRRQKISLEYLRLGDNEFHEIGFRDPSEQLVSVVEARTFSPPQNAGAGSSICGEFLELSLATGKIEDSERFWGSLGFKAVANGSLPYRWSRLGCLGAALGFHEAPAFRPALTFTTTQIDARLEYLRAKGFDASPGAPVVPKAHPAITLRLTDQIYFYLIETRDAERDG
ncbi:MAG TPA: hypothetical protein VGC50_04570 [Gammaproteobacteria bacterium]|jgi:hypothetical protein